MSVSSEDDRANANYMFDDWQIDIANDVFDGLHSVSPGNVKNLKQRRGYSLNDSTLQGRALLSYANYGFEFVSWLKNTRPYCVQTIEQLAVLMAKLVSEPLDVELVSYAPSSGKIPEHEYFAAKLASYVAKALELECVSLLHNPVPRGHRANLVAKLHEDIEYTFVGSQVPRKVLMIDDVVFTRKTAKRCQAALTAVGVEKIEWLVLYCA